MIQTMDAATFKAAENRHLDGLNSGHFTWNITDEQLIKYMLKCPHGQGFQSKPFKMANLRWQITLFPNGETEHNTDDATIYLSPLNMPQLLQELDISWIIQCNQTGVGHSSVNKITRHQMSVGGAIIPLSLLKAVCPSSGTLSITVSTNILSLKIPLSSYLTKYHLGRLPSSILNNAIINTITNTNCSWSLNPDMFHEITCRDCDVGQRFLSPIYDNLWQLQCQCDASTLGMASTTFREYYGTLPSKSVHLTGNIGLYLKMVNPPPTTRSVECTVTFSCPEVDTVERIHFEFDRTNGFESGIHEFLTKTDVRLRDMESFTFMADIDVIDVVEFELYELANEGIVVDEEQIAEILSPQNQRDRSLMTLQEAKIAMMESKIESMQQTIESMQQQIWSNQQKYVNLEQKMNHIAGSSSKQNEIVDVQREVRSLKALISQRTEQRDGSWKKAINGVTAKIEALRQSMQSQPQRNGVIELRKRVENLQKELASQYKPRIQSLWSGLQGVVNNVNSMQSVVQQNASRIMAQKRKGDGVGDIRERMNRLEINVNRLLNEGSHGDDKENSELVAVRRWMISVVKLPQYLDVFIENGFDDLSLIQMMRSNDLEDLGIDKKGHRLKIMREIDKLTGSGTTRTEGA